MKILVTRPSPTGEELVHNLNNIGIFSCHFPLFNCFSNDNSDGLSQKIHILYQSDIIIIFSQAAVYYTHLYLQKNHLKWPCRPEYYTIGKSTAFLLHQYIKKKLFFHILTKIVNLYSTFY